MALIDQYIVVCFMFKVLHFSYQVRCGHILLIWYTFYMYSTSLPSRSSALCTVASTCMLILQVHFIQYMLQFHKVILGFFCNLVHFSLPYVILDNYTRNWTDWCCILIHKLTL